MAVSEYWQNVSNHYYNSFTHKAFIQSFAAYFS